MKTYRVTSFICNGKMDIHANNKTQIRACGFRVGNENILQLCSGDGCKIL